MSTNSALTAFGLGLCFAGCGQLFTKNEKVNQCLKLTGVALAALGIGSCAAEYARAPFFPDAIPLPSDQPTRQGCRNALMTFCLREETTLAVVHEQLTKMVSTNDAWFNSTDAVIPGGQFGQDLTLRKEILGRRMFLIDWVLKQAVQLFDNENWIQAFQSRCGKFPDFDVGQVRRNMRSTYELAKQLLQKMPDIG